MQANKDKNQAPINQCQFDNIGNVTFAEKGKDYEFNIIGYSGKEIKNHWWWGNLAFDMTGLKFAKKPTPILMEHSLSSRLGFAKEQKIEDQVYVNGDFLENQIAQDIKNDMKKGFPMEASLSLVPSVIENIEDGETVEVNGFKLKGPGTVFRKAIIKEVSMCVFGADSSTSSKTFTDGDERYQFSIINSGKENDMSEKMTDLTLESFAADYPELHEQVAAKFKAEGKTEAEKGFNERIAQFAGQFSKDPEFCMQMLKDNVSFADAVKKQAENLKKAETEFAAKSQESGQQTSTEKVDAAEQAFSDDKEPVTKDDLAKSKFNEKTATKDELIAHFAEDKKLQSEFVDAETYAAAILGDRGEI